jgi:hypothetical protein
MAVSRWVVLGALAGVSLGSISTIATAIDMPAGSKVWMKFEASQCPDADGDDCMGSNQAGPNPPLGLPLTTFGSGSNTATGYGEILPGQIHIFSRGVNSNFLHASFEDSYTVVGNAEGPFDIPVEFHATGEARSVGAGCPSSICHQLFAFGEAEIGVFQTFTDGGFSEGLRVSAFDAQSSASFSFTPGASGAQFSLPIDVTAHHTVLNVSVGDTFTLAFGLNWRSSRGEGDLRIAGGVASFDLPPGVQLVSSLAESLMPDPGDYNGDGLVDAADYVTWRKSPDDHGGDPGGYETWRTNFGSPSGSGAAGTRVPEPSSVFLLLMPATLLLPFRRR